MRPKQLFTMAAVAVAAVVAYDVYKKRTGS
jgi:hypothetical protein